MNKPPQLVSLSSPPISEPPIPHPNARYLMLYLKRWHLLEIWHSGGFCGARCVFCTHSDREKEHFWSCPDRPLLQDVSIINVITMLQCQIWGRGTGNVGKWEALKTRGTGGKDRNVCHSIPAAGFSPISAPRVARSNTGWYKIEMGPIGDLVEFW